MAPAAIDGISPGVYESLRECLSHVLEVAEIGVVAFPFTSQQGVNGMMKIIIPLSVQAIATKFCWPYYASVIQCTLCDDIHTPIESCSLLMDGFGKFFENIQRGVIEYGVHGIKPQRVEVIVRNPLQRI